MRTLILPDAWRRRAVGCALTSGSFGLPFAVGGSDASRGRFAGGSLFESVGFSFSSTTALFALPTSRRPVRTSSSSDCRNSVSSSGKSILEGGGERTGWGRAGIGVFDAGFAAKKLEIEDCCFCEDCCLEGGELFTGIIEESWTFLKCHVISGTRDGSRLGSNWSNHMWTTTGSSEKTAQNVYIQLIVMCVTISTACPV